MRLSWPGPLRFAQTSLHLPPKQSGSGVFSFRSRWCYCDNLLLTWRWRFFWLSLLSTFRLPVSLAVIGCGRRDASLLLLLLLLLLLALLALVLGRRRLSVSALHSFSLAARLPRGSATRRRRDRLTESRRPTSTTLLTFTCASRRRRAEPLTLRFSLVTLRRNLPCPTLPGTWFLSWSSRWLAPTLLLLRRCTLES